MNIGEMLDQRAAEGTLGAVTLIRVGKLWQVYVTSAATGSHVARREPTPSQSLEAALNLLPFSEDYDRKHGLARINAPAEEPVSAAGQISQAAHPESRAAVEPPGVFD